MDREIFNKLNGYMKIKRCSNCRHKEDISEEMGAPENTYIHCAEMSLTVENIKVDKYHVCDLWKEIPTNTREKK